MDPIINEKKQMAQMVNGNSNGFHHPGIEQQPSSSQEPANMSQWAKVQQNTYVLEEMTKFYNAHFPLEIRYFLCKWIEEQQWDKIGETSVGVAEQLIQTMLDLLYQKVAEFDQPDFFVIKMRLEQAVHRLEEVGKATPMKLIGIIKDCLRHEQRLLQQSEQADQQQQMSQEVAAMPDGSDVNAKLQIIIGTLNQKTRETEEASKALQQKQESFIIQYSDSQRFTSHLNEIQKKPPSAERDQEERNVRAQKEKLEQRLNQMANTLLVERITLGRKYEETIKELQDLQKQILDNELMAWKRRQQLAGNGLIVSSANLENLQQWCEDLADLIWQNRQQIKRSTQLQQQLPIKFPEGEEDRLPKLNDTITGLLSSLVTSTFIVEQQPPQVLKKDARFGAVVRLLVGRKLNVHMNPPHVLATVISESQAKDLLKNDLTAKSETSGDILNNSGTMEFQPAKGILSIQLRNMNLKKIRRTDKKGSEAVTEEKFCILFQSEFNVGGNELVFQVWTISLPVVVTVHGNQECNATATVLWDNAFAELGRVPFLVPEQVEWQQLADQLNIKFQSCTGKELSEINLQYIASKLFGNAQPGMVSWSQFNKDSLPGKQFTFWEWFHAILKLVKEHLKDLWMNNTIIGFLGKDQAQSWLSQSPMGTFLLRFSDTGLGGVTAAWHGEGNQIWHLAPFSSKDFQIRGLADRIRDLGNLAILYPNLEKNAVFSKYYSLSSESEQPNPDNYIKTGLKTTIDAKYNPNQDDTISNPYSPDPTHFVYSNPSSVGPQDIKMTDDQPIYSAPILDEFGDMDLNSYTDYMPDDMTDATLQPMSDATVQEILASTQLDMMLSK